MTHRDLAEADLPRKAFYCPLMIGITPTVHQHYCDCINALGTRRLQRTSQAIKIEWRLDPTVCAQPFLDLNHLCVELFRLKNFFGEDICSGLIADPKRIPKTFGD